jgi:plastocyanin
MLSRDRNPDWLRRIDQVFWSIVSPPASGMVVVTIGNIFSRSDRNGSANAAVDTVPVGGKVRWQWVNTGATPHGVASVGTPNFTSGPVEAGSANIYELTFTAPGVHRYNCAVHGNLMTGMIAVADASPSATSVR